MPKVHHVKKCRKDYPEKDIKKGDEYWWWKFNFGPTIRSKTKPRRSQLTRSGFLSQLYEIQDNSSRWDDITSTDDFEAIRDDLINELTELKEECECNLENMPQHLQESSQSGETLTERIDGLDSWISDLESVDLEIDEELDVEDRESRVEEIKQELEDCNQYL